jgi:hypothetical protein
MIQNLRNITQVYTGEYQSFAVSNLGDIRAWGLNKHNILLTDQSERGVTKNIVVEPMVMQLPDYFVRSSSTHITESNQIGFGLFSCTKPVKSIKVRAQEELDKCRRDNATLRKRNRDYATRLTLMR